MNSHRSGPAIEIILVVAVADNGVIGNEGGMPWRLSTDLKRFKTVTMGRPIIMGRKTFQSIGKALPGRTNIVVTRDDRFTAKDVQTVKSVDAALEFARKSARRDGANAICVIGGGEIYRQVFTLADRIFMTHVESNPEGDTHFPAIDPAEWERESEEAIPTGAKDSVATRYVVYRKKSH